MFRRKLINGSFEWMGITYFMRADGPPWTVNILALMWIGGAEFPVPVRTCVVNLGDTQTVFISIGISLLVNFQFTNGGCLKAHAALGAASVTIYSARIIHTACKAPPHIETPSAVAW